MVSKLKPTFITDEFVKAILDSIATGNKIILTTSIGSSTIYTDQQLNGINYQQTQGSSKNITAPLNSAVVKLDTNTIIIELDLTNENLNNDFQIATVLINGKYKGNDLLVGVVRFEAPELFPKYDSTTGSIYEIKSRVYLSLSNISNATIAVSNAGMATAQSVQDLRTYVDGAFNSDIARKSIDNIYNGNNTYNKKIIAPAGLQGNSDSSDKLQTARTIQTNLASTTATSFDGTANVVPGVTGTLPIANGGTGNTNGSAVKLTTARTIGGISFDGTKNIDLPGVNSSGNQDTTGLAARANQLAANRTIKLQGVVNGSGTFDGTNDLTIKTDPTITENNKNADLSTFNTAGNFYVYGDLKNAPISYGYALLQVFKMNGGLVQAFTDLQTEKTYTRTNISSQGYGNWILNADDSTVVHNTGSQSIAGSLTIPVDNSMINVGNDADLAMVKKQGQGATLVVGNGKTFKLQKSSSAKISPTDTLTDLLSVDQGGNVVATSFKGKIKSIFLENNTDLYQLIEPGYTYFEPTVGGANTILNKPSEVTTAFSVTTIDIAGYTEKSFGSTQLFLIEHVSGKIFTANLSASSNGNIVVNKSWTKIPTDDSKLVHNTGDTMTGGLKGGQVNLPASGDLNTLTDTGKYYQTTSVNTANWTNRPSNSPSLAFSVDVIGQANGSPATQVYYVHTTSRMWVRTMWLDGTTIGTSQWAELADDSTVVHNSGNETVNGVKSFLQKIKGTIDRSDTSGLADKATKLAATHKIGGLAFDGTQDLTLPGVNAKGNQDTTGNSASSSSPKSTGIDVNTDLNSLRSDGYYTFMAGSVINSPVYGWFSLTVTTIGAYNGNQVLIDSNTGNIWVRSWNKNNVYTEWKNTSFSEKVKLQTLPENYNVDGAKSGGNYTGTNGKLVGLPASPVWGTLEVIESSYGDIVQRFNVTSGSDVTFWQRRYTSGSNKWSDWKTF